MKDATEIVLVLDRSGSMEPRRAETIQAFNDFVRAQREMPGEASLTLIQFDYEYDVVFTGVRLPFVAELTFDRYEPRGITALIGAQCRAIDETGARLAAMPLGERPDKVVMVTLTDGYENATHAMGWSKKYTREILRRKTEHQRDKYSWQFVWLGKPADSVEVAGEYGVQLEGCYSWVNDTVGGALVSSASPAIGAYRSGEARTVDLANSINSSSPKK